MGAESCSTTEFLSATAFYTTAEKPSRICVLDTLLAFGRSYLSKSFHFNT